MGRPTNTGRRAALRTLALAGVTASAGASSAAKPGECAAYQVDDLSRALDALRHASNHLDASPGTQLVIVALSGAVDFLIEGTPAPHGNSYAALVDTLQFRGVRFRACNNTLKARSIARSKLLPDVEVVESGIAELVRLQVRERYAYIKV